MSYIGQGLGQGQAERFVFTAAGGETSVTLDDSGRGVAYTVGQVDVYLNGVKLVNGTDFTATTGSSITGLSALSASDVIDIVALSTFDVADTVSKSSGGTFDSAVIFADGITVDNDGATVATFDRATSDGDIVEFQKSGTTVGSIGYVSTGLYIDGEAGHAGFRFGGLDVTPRRNGADVDATVQLGTSTSRFKDLYLSGGVYLGGTGAANYLDDYETGTWNPEIYYQNATNQSNSTNNTQNGYYVKNGSVVTVAGYLNWTLTGTAINDNIGVKNLPFTSYNGDGYIRQACALFVSGASSYPASGQYLGLLYNGQSRVFITDQIDTGNYGNEIGAGTRIVSFVITYRVS